MLKTLSTPGIRLRLHYGAGAGQVPILSKWCRPLLARDGYSVLERTGLAPRAWPEELGLNLLSELNLPDGGRLLKLIIDR
ncbi:MAG: hypothetical protein IPK53_01485 [bacterium]|nr:hypothetical protein [bacterium]